MTTKELSKITHTKDGSQVKDLRWLPIDNVIVGFVFDSLLNKFVTCTWRKQGSVTKKYGGETRKNHYLKMK